MFIQKFDVYIIRRWIMAEHIRSNPGSKCESIVFWLFLQFYGTFRARKLNGTYEPSWPLKIIRSIPHPRLQTSCFHTVSSLSGMYNPYSPSNSSLAHFRRRCLPSGVQFPLARFTEPSCLFSIPVSLLSSFPAVLPPPPFLCTIN